jgi:ribosomal protein S18 acetylase RimI-like enzyme
MDLKFKTSKKNELFKALNLLYLAAEMLKEKGVNQWQFWLNPNEEKVNWVREGFANNEFFFVENAESDLIGMFRLMANDELYWGKQTVKAGYIHSLVVKKEYAGQKLGNQIMAQIEANLFKNNVFLLRLDCNSTSLGLCKYYESLGFKKIGEKQMPHSLNNLYEKNLV